MKSTFFISDIHLSHEKNAISQKFLYFINQLAPTAEALYILGDLFDFWIGEDCMSPYQQQLLQKLTQLAQVIPIYWMPGNRDFLCNPQWIQRQALHYLSDPTLIELYGKKIWLLHGDTLCIHDKSYQYYRKIVQHPMMQKLFLNLPKKWRMRIANRISQHSYRRHHMNVSENSSKDVIPKAILSGLWQPPPDTIDTIIHGHIHYPMIHLYRRYDRFYARYVLSDWGKKGNYLQIDENHQGKLIYF